MFMMYMVSCMYHALGRNNAKRVFRVLDHCCVFLLIAGTYTPFLLGPLRGVWGWSIFGVIWALAIVGIVFNAIDLSKYQAVSAGVNIAMGWLIVIRFSALAAAIGKTCLYLLIGGGVVYTVGAVLYIIGSKVRYMHSIWHFFVLGGTIMHFLAIYFAL